MTSNQFTSGGGESNQNLHIGPFDRESHGSRGSHALLQQRDFDLQKINQSLTTAGRSTGVGGNVFSDEELLPPPPAGQAAVVIQPQRHLATMAPIDSENSKENEPTDNSGAVNKSRPVTDPDSVASGTVEESATCLCCIPIKCGMTIISVLYLLLCVQIIYTSCVFSNVRHKVSARISPETLEKTNFPGSMTFYWVLWGIDATKLLGLPTTLVWLGSDNSQTRLWLSRTLFLGWLSSALSLIFCIFGLFIMRETFFPKGLSQDNQTYAMILMGAGIIPLLGLLYCWQVSRKFARMDVVQDSS